MFPEGQWVSLNPSIKVDTEGVSFMTLKRMPLRLLGDPSLGTFPGSFDLTLLLPSLAAQLKGDSRSEINAETRFPLPLQMEYLEARPHTVKNSFHHPALRLGPASQSSGGNLFPIRMKKDQQGYQLLFLRAFSSLSAATPSLSCCLNPAPEPLKHDFPPSSFLHNWPPTQP